MFIANDVQLNYVAFFCVDENGVLSIERAFNLCSNWITDTCYKNTGLETQNGKHPFLLEPILIHFEKDALKKIFNRFASEMCSFQSKIKNLKTIGNDQEMAIYNGFASQIPDLNLLLCVFYLQKSDERKFLQLNPRKGASRKIIADIYGCQYGGVREYGLTDSTNKEDLEARLRGLEERWELLCPGFCKWFNEKRKPICESSVTESARKPTNVQGLYYNNTIEAQHFFQKTKQSFKAGTISEKVGTLKTLTERQ